MDTSELDPADEFPIYVGTWTNWNRGSIMGATLTLKKQDADILIAITAFFTAYVATRSWRIICFFLHRLYSDSNPQDALYHQRQAILRNSSSSENGVYLLLRLIWANRYFKQRFRPLPTATVGIICFVSFTAAGIYSSRISTAPGNEVIINSSNCGILYGATDPNVYYTAMPYAAELVDNAANYVQRCYSKNTAGLDCDRFVKKQIKGAKDFHAPCPFNDVMCRNSSANIRIDSGFLDSHEHFGINTPTNQRILWRNVLHCAPLATTNFSSQKTSASGNLTVYHYGRRNGLNESFDYIYAADTIKSQYSRIFAAEYVPEYSTYRLEVYTTSFRNKTVSMENSDFLPIDLILQQDGDIYIAFLSGNGVIYSHPTLDEWYQVGGDPIEFWDGVSFKDHWEPQIYLPILPASPLGCTDKYQFCNNAFAGTSGCGPLTNLRDAIAGASPFFNTDYTGFGTGFTSGTADTETMAPLVYFAGRFFGPQRSFHGVLQHLGPRALLSHRTLINIFQGPLPSNQWQLDVSHIWDVTMAAKQADFVEGTRGPTEVPSAFAAWVNLTSPSLMNLCKNQKIRSTGYGSFSLFGLYFTYAVGLVLIIISYILEPVSAYFYKRAGYYNKYAHLEWTTNSTLQLQRLAHEEIRLGTWSKCADVMPVTKEDELLGCLDITDPERPILQAPVKESEEPGSDQAHNPNGSPDSTSINGDTCDASTQSPKKTP